MENKEINADSVCKNCGKKWGFHSASKENKCPKLYEGEWLSTTFELKPEKTIAELKEEFYEKFTNEGRTPISVFNESTYPFSVWQWNEENLKPK